MVDKNRNDERAASYLEGGSVRVEGDIFCGGILCCRRAKNGGSFLCVRILCDRRSRKMMHLLTRRQKVQRTVKLQKRRSSGPHSKQLTWDFFCWRKERDHRKLQATASRRSQASGHVVFESLRVDSFCLRSYEKGHRRSKSHTRYRTRREAKRGQRILPFFTASRENMENCIRPSTMQGVLSIKKIRS